MLVVLAMLVGVFAVPVIAAPQMQGGNLLQNANFEGGTNGWNSWYFETEVYKEGVKPKEIDPQLSYFAPTFMPSESKWNRGEGGSAGAISGQQYKKFRAGFYQTVNVPAGSRVRFSIWANGYCRHVDGTNCPVIAKAGIEPNGDTNWQSGGIQWAETQVTSNEPRGYAQLATAEVTVGATGRVTVFAWGEPAYPVLYNAAYFDDASLVVTAAGPTPTPAKDAAPAQPAQPPVQQPAQPAVCADLRWVADVTVPDGTGMLPGAQFVKTWKIRNAGSCAFSGTLNFVGKGNQMGGPSPMVLPKINAGAQADVSVNLTAPTQPGEYQGTWQPRTSDGTSMENLVVKIKVSTDAAPLAGAVTATPQGRLAPTPAPTAPPTPTTGQVCIQAYNDRNGDGQQGGDENLLAGVVFTLSDAGGPKDSYTTDGVSEPHCFTGLQPGSYQLAAKAPANYSATTQKSYIVALNSGGKSDWALGVRRGGPAPTPTRTGGAASAGLASAGRMVLIVVSILVLIGLGFVGGFLLLSRRR
jgi:hypothetical protein